MAREKGFRSAAAKRLSESIEYPEDPADDLGDNFYDDEVANTESAIKSKTFDLSGDDVKGAKGWYKLLSGQTDERKPKTEMEE